MNDGKDIKIFKDIRTKSRAEKDKVAKDQEEMKEFFVSE
jgi:hypothetical protein